MEVRYPPSKGVSQRYLRDTLSKQGKRVRYPPLRYCLEKVLHDMGGGISHWAAKDFSQMTQKNLETGRTRKLQRRQGQCWAQLVALEAEKQDLLSQLRVLKARVLQLESADTELREQTQKITSENQRLREANQTLTLANQSLTEDLSAPKSRDSLQLQPRSLPLPHRIARFLRPQDARFPSKSLAIGDFLCD